MRYIITEEQLRKYVRSSDAVKNVVGKYLKKYFSNSNRRIKPPSRNYGNYQEYWCNDGKVTASAYYYYEDGSFNQGSLGVSKKIVDDIKTIFNIKESYILHIIEEWYEDNMIPAFEKEVGETGLYLHQIYIIDNPQNCVDEPVFDENLTNEDMIDFIVKNTLHRRPDIEQRFEENGEEWLKNEYLHILEIVNDRKVNR